MVRDDERIVDESLRLTQLTELADRPLEELSGGQRHRAWLAMVLAQQTPVILLDERLLAEVFGLAAHVFPDPVDGLPTVVPSRAPALRSVRPVADDRG